MKKQLLLWSVFSLALGLSQCRQPSSPSSEQEAGQDTALSDNREVYLSRGKEIAQATFAELSGQLGEALARGGVPEAIPYCQITALPLTDSLSEIYQAGIRRTSLQWRNPSNAPTEFEERILQEYQSEEQEGKELKPRLERLKSGEIAFFAPIRIQPLCLQCHGKVGEELAENHYALIMERYPDDQAVGYALNDLRGMWSITFAGSR